jgi:gliding motility-associated-like protein
MKISHLFAAIGLSCLSLSAFAQNFLGTDFRAMFMRNLEQSINGLPSFEFSIYAPAGAEVTITYGMPSDPYFQQQTGTVLPNGQFTFAFANQILEQENYNIAETRSFHITANTPIRVYAMVFRPFFSEGTALLPITACGSAYWVTTYQETAAVQSQVSILAYTDSTAVTVVPSVATVNGPAGVPFDILLQMGETYTLDAIGTDLTNTHIFGTGETPFAVFAGHRRTIVGGCNADSHLYEQLSPVDVWGTGFALIPPGGSGGEQVRITAASDGTEIYQGCDDLLFTLDAGETVSFLNSTPLLIGSNNPVQVVTFSRGRNCTIYETGDPNMRLILPVEKAITEVKLKTGFSFSSVFPGDFLEFFHIVMPTANTGHLTLNGNSVTWTPFGTQPGISYARVEADEIETLTTITSLSPFWAEQVALGAFDAITMSLGSDTIMELPPLGSAQVSLGPDFSICPGTIATLQVAGNLAAIWQDGSQENTFAVSEPGVYYVTIDGPCAAASDTVQVGLFDPAEVLLDTAFFACSGQQGTITVVPLAGYQYTWSNGTTGPELTTDVEGAYQIIASSPDGCEVSAETILINFPLPEVAIGGASIICEDSTAILTASPQDGAILWNTGGETASITITESGEYTLVYTDTNGCIDSASINITRVLLPFVFTNDTTVCAGEEALLRATSPNGDLLWVGLVPGETPQVPPGIYTVLATNICGTTRATATVFEDPCLCEARIPNIFSPNGDGRNDTFEPLIDCEPLNFSLNVYDRWGKKVFTTLDTNTRWQGTSDNGAPSTEGVYFYTLRYLNTLPQIPRPLFYQGTLTLVR